MKVKKLEAQIRTETGKGPSGRLRRQNYIPAVLYGHTDSMSIMISAHEFSKNFSSISDSVIISLNVAGSTHDVLIKDYQYDIVKEKITHIDFYEIERGKFLRTHIGVHLAGSAMGVRVGGILNHVLHQLEVECLPADIVGFIDVDVSALAMGDFITVGDLSLPQRIKSLSPPDQVVVAIVAPKTGLTETVESVVDAESDEGTSD